MSANKKAKTESGVESEAPEEFLSELDSVQDKLEKMNEEAAEKILEVEKKYNELKQPLYKQRSEVCSKIPDFWLTALQNYDYTAELMTEEDLKAFKHLKDFWVEEYDGLKGYKISFTFEQNPYFLNQTIYKEVKYSDEGDVVVSASDILWKEGKDLTRPPKVKGDGKKRKEEEMGESFFRWFSDQETDLADTFKDDFWPNVVKIYHGQHETISEFEELDGEGEGDEAEEAEEGEDGDGEGEEDA
eukprot:TRINITY_DN164_c0_g1_i1.p1 TRINITY_DN164_c0_g1~~TRINITY_DN164_c0_g1_i1.p1  ORF type:complete len:244 (+),score=75.92 TRINITY_DN164_c0_g1_i1:92-823(+)